MFFVADNDNVLYRNMYQTLITRIHYTVCWFVK